MFKEGVSDDLLDANTAIEGYPDLVYERPEFEDIKSEVDWCRPNTSAGFNILINGCSGSGKTLLVKYILYNKMVEDPNLVVLWAEGDAVVSTKALFRHFCGLLACSTKGTTEFDYIAAFKDRLAHMDKRVVIVIDDVDKLFHNVSSFPKYTFMMTLMRMQSKPRPSCFFITSEFNFFKHLKPEVTSTLRSIIFKAYTTNDLFHILNKRATYCLKPGSFTEADLSKIAKEVYINPVSGGDFANARNAINILGKAVHLASAKGTQLSSFVDEAIKVSRASEYTELFNKYNHHLQLLIKCLASLKLKKIDEASGISKFANPSFDKNELKDVFYDALKDDGCQDLTERTFNSYITTLLNDRVLFRSSSPGTFVFYEDPALVLYASDEAKVNRMLRK